MRHWSGAWRRFAVLCVCGPLAALAQDPETAESESSETESTESQAPEPAPDTIPVGELRPSAEPSPASAALEPEAPAPVSAESRLMDEVMVTAQKRSEVIQDVPVSVQAFSGEKLDALGVYDQSDLQRVTPGLNVSVQVSYVMTFLRGIGTDATIAADPSVATYIDGIYFPFASLLAQNFGAVQRIEVLKGPQGTLFGRNATGGAISIWTREPTIDGFSGELMVNGGSFGSRILRGHANLPVGERYALSATAYNSVSDGYYSGTRGTPAEPFPRDDSTGYRVKFRALPIDELDLRVAVLKYDLYSSVGTAGFTATPSRLGTLQGVTSQPGYHGSLDAFAEATGDNTVYYGSAEYHAPWFDVKLLGSDQRMDTTGIRDFDGSPQTLSTFDTPSQYIDAQSAELQFISNGQGDPHWLKWLAGGYWFRGVQGFGDLNFIINGIDLEEGRLAGLTLPAAFADFLRNAPGAPTGAINLTGLIGTDSRAVFAQGTFTLAPWLDLTLGGRYQVEERYIVESTVGLENADGSETRIADNSDRATDSDGNPHEPRDEQKDFSPKIGIELRPFEDDSLIYLSWQRAVKAATYNTVAIYETPDYVAPEEVDAIELGLKTALFDGLLHFNIAAFHYDVQNLQTYYLSTMAGGVISFQNAGRARIDGVDFDGLLRIAPDWIDSLVLSGGLSWLDARYEDFDNASGFDEDGMFVTGQDYSGNQAMRTPRWSGNASLAKTWQIAGGPLEAVFDAYHTDEFWYEASNRSASHQEAYWLLGGRLSYLYKAWDLRATLGVKNLSDEFYTAGYFATDYGVQPVLAAPRSYFLQLIWTF